MYTLYSVSLTTGTSGSGPHIKVLHPTMTEHWKKSHIYAGAAISANTISSRRRRRSRRSRDSRGSRRRGRTTSEKKTSVSLSV